MVSHFGILDNRGFGRTFALSSGFAKLSNKVTLLTTIKGIRNFPYKKITRDEVKIIAFYDFIPQKYLINGFGILSLIGKIIYALAHKFEVIFSDTGHRPLSGWPCLINKYLYSSFYVSEWWDLFEVELKKEFSFFRRLITKHENYVEIKHRQKADAVIVLSSLMKKRAILKGIAREKIEIVHGGADIDRIAYFESNFFKEKYGFQKESIVLGMIGISDYDVEDLHPFLLSMNELKNEKKEWFTTGKGLSKETIEKYNVDSRLHKLGWINYAISTEVLSCADVFVLIKKPTLRNLMGWPNKLGDYWAAGRIVMISPYGDISEYVREHPDIFIEIEFTKESIIKAIKYCLLHKEDLKLRNRDVRRIAETQYSWKLRAKKIIDFISKNKEAKQ